MTDRPMKRKYARIERERRFSLKELPKQVDSEDFERLRDRYLDDTQVRLRLIESPDGSFLIAKLGQKIFNPEQPDNPRHRMMTTLYLTKDEWEVFAALSASCSTKRRYKLVEQGWTFVIDVYEQPESVEGLIVAEVECDTDEQLEAIVCPTWAIRETTDEEGWSGAIFARGVVSL